MRARVCVHMCARVHVHVRAHVRVCVHVCAHVRALETVTFHSVCIQIKEFTSIIQRKKSRLIRFQTSLARGVFLGRESLLLTPVWCP